MGRRSKRGRHLAALASAKRPKREEDSSEDDDSIEIEVEEVDDMEPMPGTFSFKRRSPFYLGNSRTTQWRNRVKEGKRLEEIIRSEGISDVVCI